MLLTNKNARKQFQNKTFLKPLKIYVKTGVFKKVNIDLSLVFPPYSEMAENNLNLSDLKKYKFKGFELRPSLH